MRSARDRALAMPTLMLPAVQLKLRAGQLSASQDNGVSYVKIPINVI
jgi:hypothetical protein